MSFFGKPNPSTTQGTGIFGNANPTAPSNANTASNGLFGAQPTGGAAAAKPAASGGLFGGLAAPAGAGSLFGGGTASSTAPTSGTGGGSVFGSTSANTSSNPLFGGASLNTNANNTSTSAPSTSANPLFSGFNLPKPGDSNPSALKPASSFFGPPSAPTGSTATASGGLFGNPAAKADGGPTQSTGTAPPSGGGLFGAKLGGTAAAGAQTASSTAFALGGNKDSNVAPPFSLGGNKDTSTSTAPSGLLFGTKPLEKKDGAAPQAPAPAFNLFGGTKANDKKDAAPANLVAPTKEGDQTKAASTAAAPSSNPVVAVPPPSMLRGKTIEEIVNRWTSELETHVKDFWKFGGEVAVWDRALIENGNNLAALFSHVLSAERQQSEIDQTLDHIEQQQKDLMSTLDAYEKVSQEILGGQGGGLRTLDTGPADTERDKNYMLATDLHTNLDDLSSSLTQMIDSVNTLSTSQKPVNEGGDDAMAQISQVLSSHLESLQWIDSAVRDVDSKVTEVEKRVKESGHTFGSGNKSRGYGLNR